MAARPPRPRLTSRLELAGRCALVPLLSLLAGCRGEPSLGTLSVLLPEAGARPHEITPRSAFAEAVELPELKRELRLTFASYELSCDKYVAPGPSDLAVVVTVSAPPDEPIGTGSTPAVPPEPTDAGLEPTTRKSVVTVARRADRSFVLPAGGGLDLVRVDAQPGGRVVGLLALEFPGDAKSPAAAVRGKFDIPVCRAR